MTCRLPSTVPSGRQWAPMASVLLLSGGLDSAALACWSRPERILFIDYGQPSAPAERRAAQRVSADLSLPWAELSVDCRSIGPDSIKVQGPGQLRVPLGWWPYRNQLIVTFAGAWALAMGCDEVILGTVATDQTLYRDGTPWFIATVDALMQGQEGVLRVCAPAIDWTTEELVTRSGISRRTLAATYSCQSGPLPCGDCGGCLKRQEVIDNLESDRHWRDG